MTQARLLGGRYQVGELLGYGGMAEVHRGRDLRLGRDVAIKMLRTDLARDDTFQLRFRREAQNAASLNHPAIVAVYDTGEERGATGESLPYIVMEFVNGRTLEEVLANEGRLMPRRALEITAEICSALEFSHRHGIIHRDIKPGNVMLTQTGQVKVMDFGIARALASGTSTMTQTSAVIGTAQYLSPEQARGESVDARSDVYATGCVLYELLCGHPPFVGDSPVSVAYQHVREDPKPPSASNRDLPPQVDAVVLKALAKNPANRYQSAAEMRADLLRAAAGRPVYAEPVLGGDAAGATAVTRVIPPGGRAVPARVGDSRKRSTSTWTIAGLSALAVLAVVALVVGLILWTRPVMVEMPNLVGMDRFAAEQALRDAGLEPDPKSESGADCVPDQVVRQDIPATTPVREGTVVGFTYCLGPGQVKVPNVVGLDQASARVQLEAARLEVGEVIEVDSAEPAGRVVGTEPEAGSDVAEGSTVNLRVSKGNLKFIRDVTGRTPEAAIEILVEAGFLRENITTAQRKVDDPGQDGRVVGQDPEPDQNRPRDPANTRITLFVGDYDEPEPTTSPEPSETPPPGGGD